MRASIVSHEIDVPGITAEVAGPGNGATSLFLGTVRNSNNGSPVSGIEYSAYAEMAERELLAILAEAAASFGTEDIVVEHRLGTLGVGDVSVAVAAAHPRRRQAQDCVAFVVEELKRRVPIWKLEHYVDGRREWVGAGIAAVAGTG